MDLLGSKKGLFYPFVFKSVCPKCQKWECYRSLASVAFPFFAIFPMSNLGDGSLRASGLFSAFALKSIVLPAAPCQASLEPTLSLALTQCPSAYRLAPTTTCPNSPLWKERKRTKKESKKNGKRTQLRYDVGMSETRTPNVFFRTRKQRNKQKNYFEHEKLEKCEIHLNKTFET